MKKFLCLLITVLCLGIGSKSYATHVIGADITYTCDSAYAYTFKLVYYRYCGGVPLSNPSGNTQFISLQTGTKVGVSLNLESIKEVTPLCKSASARCYPSNTSRTGDGIEAHTYTVSVDFKKAPYSNLLSNGTCEIRFETGQCCRNSNITTGAANQNFYTYAVLNICEAQVNNSPQFLYPPIGYLCCNQPSYSSVGGFDLTDFDSLSYSFADPLRGYNNRISYSGNYTYEQPFRAYYPGTLKYPFNNPDANPPIGIYLDEANGSVVWTPMKCDEITVAVLEIIEWRKDSTGTYKKIGLTRRDMQYVTKQCPDNNPPIIKGNKSQTITLNPCMEEYCFTIQTFDRVFTPPPPLPTPSADTVSFEPPNLPYGVSFNILNPNDTNPSAEICVDLRKVDLTKLTQHPLIFPITIRDNACPLNAVSTYVYRLQFDTTNATGKVHGFTLNDINSNCTLNTGEDSLRHIRKVGFSKQSYYQYTESNGGFAFCVDTGTTVASLMPSPWFVDQCASDTIQIQKDSIHDIVFYSKLKDGIAGYVYTGGTSCKIDSNSTPIRGQMVVAQPGNHYVTTDKEGYYLFDLDSGKYTISLFNDTSIWKNRCTKSISVSLSANETKHIDTFINYYKTITDLDVKLGFSSGTTVRKGTDCYANLVVSNKGISVIDSAVITVETANNIATLSKSHKSWTSLGSGTYQTTVYNLLPNVNHRLSLYLATKGLSVGNKISFIASSDSLSTKNDVNGSNNADTAVLVVVAPYDPNIKTAYPDSIFTVTDRRLTYTVEFQNEGTASAIDVVVRDTLSDLFDLSTLQVHKSSHEFAYILEGNHLWFEFNGIHLPPKSIDEPGSIGSVTFSIALNKDIFVDTLVQNRVGIYFDTENVVLTEYQTNHFKSPIEFIDGFRNLYCNSDTILIPFKTWFTPNASNQFILEMTDGSGAFSSFTPVDSLISSQTTGNFTYVISETDTTATNYRFRIRSTQTATDMFQAAYSPNIPIETVKRATVISSDVVACYGSTITAKPSAYFTENVVYLNGNKLIGGPDIVYSTDSLKHQDYVYFEQQTDLGCVVHSDTVYYDILTTPSIQFLPMDSIYCDSIATVDFNYQLTHSNGKGGTQEIHWNYGDQTTATANPMSTYSSHEYTKGKYDVTVTARHSECIDSSKVTIYVGAKPKPNMNVNANNICPNEALNVTIKTNVEFDFDLDSSFWDYGDGNSFFSSDGSQNTHRYSDSGQYNVKFVLFSQGCISDTLSVNINVIEAPKGKILPNMVSGCLPNAEFTFNSSITGDYQSYNWLIDGQSFYTDSVVRAYTTAGKKHVAFIVNSNRICVDTSYVEIDVYEQPEASFEIKESDGFEAEITNTSIRNMRNFWTIDNAEMEQNDGSFIHIFTQNGEHVIRLIIESKEGCLDTTESIATVSGEYEFYIPNTYSPNNDGINESFNVVPNQNIQSIELSLYDRFGVMVVESKDKNNLINKDLFPGVYLMNIDIIAIDGTKHVYSGVLHVW